MKFRLLFFFTIIIGIQSVFSEEWSSVKENKKGSIIIHYYNSDNFISDESGQLSGIEYDILIEFKKYLFTKGIDLSLTFKKADSFSGLYEKVRLAKSGEFGACSFSITEKRMKEVSFSPKYMPDIEVLINSQNVSIAKNQDEFISIFSELTALNVPNTTFEEDLIQLKSVIPNVKIENVETAKIIRDRILNEPDLFGYIELPTYLQLFQNGLRFKRQNLFKVERNGYGIILPKNSSWLVPVNDFFNSDDFKKNVNQIIKKHLGKGVNDLLWSIDQTENEKGEQEISLLTMEREAQEMEIEQQNLQVQLLIGGVALVLIIAFFLFYGYRIKKTVNKSLVDRNNVIENQKKELERLSLVASKTNNGVLILDANNKIEWLNKAYENITGYNLNDLLGESPGDILIDEKTDSLVLDKIRDQIERSEAWNERILVKTKKGAEIWLGINSTPVFNENNEIIKYIEIIEDVTAQVKSEVEISRLSIVAEKMNEAVLITDETGKIEYFNESLIRNSGYSEEEFRKSFSNKMYLQKITSRDDIQEIIDGFKTNSQPFFYDSSHDLKNGGLMWTTASLSPVYDNDELSKIIVVYTDISERKLFTNQLSEKNKEITDSINYAKLIQEAMLPSDNVLKHVFKDYFILFQPKDIVSGDFYWFENLNDFCLLVLADCTGHGVPGAFMSMMGSNFLSNIITDKGITSTSKALTILDEKVKTALENEKHASRDGMDIVFMAYNKETKELDFSGGNNSIFILRDKQFIKCKGDRFSIGFDGIENKEFTEERIQLLDGDIVYTFTD
ncbi:MAG: PAS domain S-box protein, partial [Vicingaceae bacterium]|nr:PAS domain S-box protein [Vicingaceae bacterium]